MLYSGLMTSEQVWATLQDNVQRVAEDNELVQPGQLFRLTDHQTEAIAELGQRLHEGDKRILLKAPTGSGKTEVFMRTAIAQVLDKGKHAVVLVPTRDLARQQSNYFEERLDGPQAKSHCSSSRHFQPRRAASRRIPAPLMPPPTTIRSQSRAASSGKAC